MSQPCPSGYQEDQGCDIDVTFQKARSIYGPDAAPFNFKIVKAGGEDGLAWEVTPKEAKKDVLIIAMLGNGKTGSETAKAAKVTRGYVSRVKFRALKEGYLEMDESGKKIRFTAAGKHEFGEVEIDD